MRPGGRRAVWGALAAALALGACHRGEDAALVLAGTLERDRLELAAEADEVIVELMVREGDPVAAGQPLVRLDRRRLELRLAAAQAEHQRATALLLALERGPRGERIAEARARQQGAAAALALARVEQERAAALVREQVLPRDADDRARAALLEATARLEQADALLLELERGTRAEDIDQARAQARASQSQIDQLQFELERLEVKAPLDAIVDVLPFELGERPPRGGAVVVLLRAGAPYARVFVPETARARVSTGHPARVSVDGVAEEMAGRVRFVSSDAAFTPFYALTEHDRGRLAYEAEIELEGATAARLPAGLPLEVRMELAP